MAIRYRIQPKKSPRDHSVKYYGVQHVRQMNANQFVENIVQKNTVTRADVLAVLASVKEELVNCFRNGNSVTLGEIGTFRITLTTKGALTRDKFTRDNIKSLHVRFLPSSAFKNDVRVGHPYINFIDMDKELNPEEGE